MADDSWRDANAEQNPEIALGIPGCIRWTLAVIFLLVAGLAVSLSVRYAILNDAKPTELGLGTIITGCLAGLAFVLIPWDRFGYSLKKIGPLEFERVIKGQKLEQIRSDTALQKRIERLESQVQNLGGGAGLVAASTRPTDELRDLITRFLRDNRDWNFNAARIKRWGAKQSGFESFANYSENEINQVLQELLLAGQVRTRISQRGNTLYGAK